MCGRDHLRWYERKRGLRRTPQPRGVSRRRTRSSRAPRFVVQKHGASSLHHDLRLEADGVLKCRCPPGSYDTPTERVSGPPGCNTERRRIDVVDMVGDTLAGGTSVPIRGAVTEDRVEAA